MPSQRLGPVYPRRSATTTSLPRWTLMTLLSSSKRYFRLFTRSSTSINTPSAWSLVCTSRHSLCTHRGRARVCQDHPRQIRFRRVRHNSSFTHIISINSTRSSGFEPGPLAEFLSRHTPTPIPYRDPIDWTRVVLISIFGLSLLLSLRFASPLIQSRWTWALGTVVTSLVMVSGYMFTRIRNMPTVGAGGWIAAGFQSQYGQEVHVVAFICGFRISSI